MWARRISRVVSSQRIQQVRGSGLVERGRRASSRYLSALDKIIGTNITGRSWRIAVVRKSIACERAWSARSGSVDLPDGTVISCRGTLVSLSALDTSAKPPYSARLRGAIAQLGERLHGMQEVGGSIPPSSTKNLICCVPIV